MWSRFPPDDELREMALRATRALGADYAGVDLLPLAGGGYTVIEVNGIPGWRGLRAATGVNAAEHVVDYVLSDGMDLDVGHETSGMR